MKSRRRFFGWFILSAGVACAGCGDDDETRALPDSVVDGGSDAEASSPDARREAAPDTSTQDARNDTAIGDASSDGDAVITDAPNTDTVPMDAPDVSTVDGPFPEGGPGDAGFDTSATDSISPTDAGTEAGPDAGTETETGGTLDGGIDVSSDGVGDGAPDEGDAGVDVIPDVPPDVTEEVIVEASLDGNTGTDGGSDAADAADTAEVSPDGGEDAEGSTPEVVRWRIEASPPECSADPSKVVCSETVVFQVRVQENCPTTVSVATLWFPPGGPPAAGTHMILPVSSIGQAFAVTGDQVAMEINRTGAERWWAQAGTVDVQLDGNRRLIQFSGVTAFLDSNHATTTTLGGFLICGP